MKFYGQSQPFSNRYTANPWFASWKCSVNDCLRNTGHGGRSCDRSVSMFWRAGHLLSQNVYAVSVTPPSGETISEVHARSLIKGVVMNASTAGQRQIRQNTLREATTGAFWDCSFNLSSLRDSERLNQIKAGFSADLCHAARVTFDIQERSFKTLFNVSFSTLERRRRERKLLGSVASERLD